MPWSNLWEPQGVRTQLSDFVTAEEDVRSAEELCADPRCDGLRFVIKDLLSKRAQALSRGGLSR